MRLLIKRIEHRFAREGHQPSDPFGPARRVSTALENHRFADLPTNKEPTHGH